MKRILLGLFSICCLLIVVITLSSNSTGITGASSSGCSCHGSQSAATVLGITGFPTNYVLGQAYPITVSVTNASKLAGGFDLTVSLGTISAASAGTTIQATLKEIGHNTPKSFTSGSCSWTFTWTAPASGSAAVTINYAGNAVNLAAGFNGDAWNKTTLTVGAPLVAPTVTASTSAILCNGGTSTITCTGTGGTTPYQYKLNSGTFQSSNIFSGNVAGIYTVTIQGANSATSSTIKTITQPTVIAIAPSSTNISCFGGSNGVASVVASGGTPGYSYSWAPSGGTGATATGLSANVYTCTITDANACTKTSTFNITAPTQLTASFSSVTMVACNGGSNGSATITPGGGTPGYNYAWAPSGGIGATASALISTIYTCTVTDNQSCTKTATVNITQPSLLTASFSATSNVSCFGLSNGSATITPAGGTPGYSYSWAPSGGSTATASGLSGNTYTCTVTDANSCTKTSTVQITSPTQLNAVISVADMVACFGQNNGSAVVSASGGTPSYTYSWNPSGGNGTTAASLVAALYTCTVTDANSCTKTTTVNITQPAFVDVVANASSTNLCNGNTLTLFGSNSASSSNYTYIWSSGVSNNISFVATATTTYTLTGTSTSGCSDQGTVAVTVNNNTDLALASAGNTNSIPGNVCVNMQQIDGQTENYTNSSCAAMASIFDQAGGNNLGNVNVCIDVFASVQTYNGEPYAARVYTITPTNQGPATITLYYTHDDIVKLNNYITANSSPYPILNFPNALPLHGDQITNASITKVTGGVLGIGSGTATPVILTYNSTKHAWVATLAVSSFSSFYLHSTNFGNAALPVDLVSFEGRNLKNEQQLQWFVNNEENISSYIVEYSTDGIHFITIGTLPPFSLTHPGKTFSYALSNKDIAYGHNYYRLKTIGVDGDENIISLVIDVRNDISGETNSSLWPNPVRDIMNLDIDTKENTLFQISVLDMTGKQVQAFSMKCIPGNNRKMIDVSCLSDGVYWLKLFTQDGQTNTLTLTVRR